jgi:hypothetical protein
MSSLVSHVGIFDPFCELFPLYLLSDRPHPSPLPKVNEHRQCQAVGGGGVLNCIVDQILQEFNTLFLTRFRTYEIATPLQTKTAVKTTFRDWCLYSSFVHGHMASLSSNMIFLLFIEKCYYKILVCNIEIAASALRNFLQKLRKAAVRFQAAYAKIDICMKNSKGIAFKFIAIQLLVHKAKVPPLN